LGSGQDPLRTGHRQEELRNVRWLRNWPTLWDRSREASSRTYRLAPKRPEGSSVPSCACAGHASVLPSSLRIPRTTRSPLSNLERFQPESGSRQTKVGREGAGMGSSCSWRFRQRLVIGRLFWVPVFGPLHHLTECPSHRTPVAKNRAPDN